ncbi:hypothetical protein J1N35_035072 [Gossypium stocksii]|uniref:Uncharacterized protein n=1 Tax=Gossypium stocksii TaxID=47602 RepID=A0A9D3ZR51_9ROSI|nr:hypothetical protein J1N35_035072 [Gossypium stocksii]
MIFYFSIDWGPSVTAGRNSERLGRPGNVWRWLPPLPGMLKCIVDAARRFRITRWALLPLFGTVKDISDLNSELTIYKAALRNGGLAIVAPNPSVDVPKSKEFKGTKSVRDMNNFLWGTEQYFYAKGIIDDAIKEEFQSEFNVQFYPKYAEDEAQEKLYQLTQ